MLHKSSGTLVPTGNPSDTERCQNPPKLPPIKSVSFEILGKGKYKIMVLRDNRAMQCYTTGPASASRVCRVLHNLWYMSEIDVFPSMSGWLAYINQGVQS